MWVWKNDARMSSLLLFLRAEASRSFSGSIIFSSFSFSLIFAGCWCECIWNSCFSTSFFVLNELHFGFPVWLFHPFDICYFQLRSVIFTLRLIKIAIKSYLYIWPGFCQTSGENGKENLRSMIKNMIESIATREKQKEKLKWRRINWFSL